VDITARKQAEAALAGNERRYRLLFEQAAHGIFVSDAHEHYTDVNEAGCRMLGYTRQEILSLGMTDILAEEEISRLGPLLAQLVDSAVLTTEWRFRRKNGSVFIGEVVATRRADGTYQGILSDITQRKEAEETIARQVREMDALYATVPTGLFQFDADLRFVRVNAWTAAMNGRSIAAHIGRTVGEVSSPELAGQLEPLLRQILQTGEPMLGFEVRGTTAARLDERDWLASFYPVHSASGGVVGVHGVIQDITERKRQEKEIEDNRRALYAVIERCPFGIFIVDADFRFASVNARSETGAFASVRPVVGHKFDDAMRIMWPEPTAAEIIRSFRHTLETGEPYCSNDFVRPRADSEQTEAYEWELHRVTMPNGRSGVVCYYYDSTQLRRVEQQLKEADRRKDEFLATLAHELRNPLAPLLAGLEIIKLAGADGMVEQARAVMERQLRLMVRLVDDLLDISRVTQGKMELRSDRLELRAVIDAALETSRPLIEQAGHDLVVTLPDEPVFVYGDATRLAQVVSNLLNNSAKYTRNGGHIRLTVQRDGEVVTVSVADDGIGIPPAMLGKVFEMFAQVDRQLEKSTGGLGIGLSLVKGLVDMHGGTVDAHSRGEGQGSEFVVTLPAAMPVVASPDAAGGQADEAVPSGRRRILVVDDNEDAADSLTQLLELLGNEVRTAYDGESGVAEAASFRPDLVLMDLGMPKMNGYEAARRIREQPWGRDVTLVAVSGWGQEDDRRKTAEAGFDHHFVKPLEYAALSSFLTGLETAKV